MHPKADGFAKLLFLTLLNKGLLYPFSRIPFVYAAAVLCLLDGGRAALVLVCFIASHTPLMSTGFRAFLEEKRALHVQKGFH